MAFTSESAVSRAKTDLAGRLGIREDDIQEYVTERDFPDMALGAATTGEVAAQMISSGWQIELTTYGKTYEYRADKYQLRLYNFEGRNFVVE